MAAGSVLQGIGNFFANAKEGIKDGLTVQSDGGNAKGLSNVLKNLKDSGIVKAVSGLFGGRKDKTTQVSKPSPNQERFYIMAGLSVIGIVLAGIAIFKK